MAQSSSATRNQAINLRASQRERDLIDQAARVLGKSRSEFMLDLASREAVNVLLDQRFFQLDDAAFERFQDMLDAPPPPSEQLRALLARKAPWE